MFNSCSSTKELPMKNVTIEPINADTIPIDAKLSLSALRVNNLAIPLNTAFTDVNIATKPIADCTIRYPLADVVVFRVSNIGKFKSLASVMYKLSIHSTKVIIILTSRLVFISAMYCLTLDLSS